MCTAQGLGDVQWLPVYIWCINTGWVETQSWALHCQKLSAISWFIRWGFEKSYDYVVSKKPDIDINRLALIHSNVMFIIKLLQSPRRFHLCSRGFVHQLFQLDKRLTQIRKSLPAGDHLLFDLLLCGNVTASLVSRFMCPFWSHSGPWNSACRLSEVSMIHKSFFLFMNFRVQDERLLYSCPDLLW